MCDINVLSDHVLRLLQHHSVMLECGANVNIVQCLLSMPDIGQLEQILFNLAMNGIQSMLMASIDYLLPPSYR